MEGGPVTAPKDVGLKSVKQRRERVRTTQKLLDGKAAETLPAKGEEKMRNLVTGN